MAGVLEEVDVVLANDLALLLRKDPLLLVVDLVAYVVLTLENKSHFQNLVQFLVNDVVLKVASRHEGSHDLNHELVIVVVSPLEVGMPDAGSGQSFELKVALKQGEE